MPIRVYGLLVLLIAGQLFTLAADAAIAYRAGSNAGVASSSSLSITLPAGTVANDVLIATIAVRPVGTTIGTPSGWTKIRNTAQSSDVTLNMATFYRVATGSDAASYTWTFSGSSHTGAVGGMLAFSGVDTSSPIEVEGGNTTSGGYTHRANQVTTSSANAMLVSSHAFTSASSGWTPPTGMTEAVDAASEARPATGGMALEMNYKTQASAAVTGNFDAVASSSGTDSGYGAGHLLALTPGSVGGGSTSPIAEWRMDEASWNGTTGEVLDNSGNANHGTTFNSASLTPGKLCGAGHFPSGSTVSNGGYAKIADASLLQVGASNADFTMTYWVQLPATLPTTSWRAIAHKGNSDSERTFAMWMKPNLEKIYPRISTTSSGDSGISASSNSFAKSTWIHISYVKSGSALLLYINGVLDSTSSLAGSTKSNTGPIYLGDDPWYSGFGGDLDEVKLFSSALSASALATGYANENAGNNWDGTTRTCPSASSASCPYPIHGGSLSLGSDVAINNHNVTGSGAAIDPNTGVRTSATLTPGALSPATFPSYSSSTDYSGTAASLTPGATYDDVTLTSGTAPNGTYYIDTLTLDGTVTFSGGTYYVNTLNIDKEENISFSATTDFRINTAVSIDKEVDLLASGAASGTVPARFFLYGSADFSADKEGRMNGIVVGASGGNSISIGKEYELTGALITPGSITIDKETELTYNAAVATALSTSGVCGSGTSSTPPTGFNCVEVGASASSGHLYTKLVGSNFNFDIVALKADGTVETTYASAASKPVTVQLVDGSGSTACTSRTSLITWPGQTFTSANAGRITASVASVASAYADLRCRVSDGSVTGCSTDNFSIRPTNFSVASSNANADAAGVSVSATPIVKAGAAFALSATAVAGYSGTPTLDTSKVQAHSGAVQAGALGGSFGAANAVSGAATGSTFNYSEAGYFRLAANGVADTTFSSVDAANSDCSADYSNTAVGGKYGCYFGNTAATGYFGRFIPDHFAVTAGVLTQGCGVFTYYGQDFSTGFTLTAQNSANASTQNYTGSFARLGLTTWSNYGFAASGSTLSQGTTAPSGSWSNGVASVTAMHKAARASSGTPTAAASLNVTAQVTDSDGVTMAASAVSSAAPHRFGRMRIANAYGSELLALPIALNAQYWNGQGFVANVDDNCTALAAPTFTYFSPSASNQLASGETSASYNSPLIAGAGGLRLTAPGVGNFGYLDVTVTAPAWLQYAWDAIDQGADGNLFDDNPRARATFGKRKGSDKVIIRREIY